jgi:hypothetical protein
MRQPDCHHKRRQPLRASGGADGGVRPSQKRFPAPPVCGRALARERFRARPSFARKRPPTGRMIPFFCHPSLELGSSVFERNPKDAGPRVKPGATQVGKWHRLESASRAPRSAGPGGIVMGRCMSERKERQRLQRVQRTPPAPSIAEPAPDLIRGNPSAARAPLREKHFCLLLLRRLS